MDTIYSEADDPTLDPVYQRWVQRQQEQKTPITLDLTAPTPAEASPEKICVLGSPKWVWQDVELLVNELEHIPRAEHYYSVAAGGTDTFCAVYLLDRSIKEDDNALHHVVLPDCDEGIDPWWDYLEYSDRSRLILERNPTPKLRLYDRATLCIQKLDPETNDQLYAYIGAEREQIKSISHIAETRGIKTYRTFLFI